MGMLQGDITYDHIQPKALAWMAVQESPTKEDVSFEKVFVEAVGRGANASVRIQPDPLLHV